MSVASDQARSDDWRSAVLEVRKDQAWDLAFYSRMARLYELWARLTEGKARMRVVSLASLSDGEAVLEVAAGTGKQLIALAKLNRHGRTIGVDLADGMLAVARRRLNRMGLVGVDLRKGDALALPFEDDSFDLVINSYMLDLLPREAIPRALAEFRRVLSPGGRLVLANMTRAERPWHRFWDVLYARGLPLTANCRGVLAAPVLREVGFVDVKREYLSRTLLPTEVIVAR